MATIADFRARLPSLEGLSDEQALSYLQQRYAPDVPVEALAQRLGVKIAAPEVNAPKRSLMAVANDTVIEAANAAAGTVGAVGNFVSPGNPVSQAIDEGIIRPGEESQSDAVKADKAKFRADMEGAQGMGDEVAAVGRYVAGSPLQAVAQAAGSFAIPGAAVKGAGALGQAAGLGAKGVSRAGMAGGAALGGAGAGGDAAGTAYELAIKAGATEEEAQAAARQASAIPAAIGAAGGLVGAERVLAGAGGFKGGLMARAMKTAGVEGVQEGVEEGVTQYEGQRAAMPFDPTIDPMKGAAGAATLGAVLGAATGGGVALLERKAAADKGLADLTRATTPDQIIDATLRATDVPLDVPTAKPAKSAGRVATAAEIRQLDPAQHQEALGLLATAENPRAAPAVRRMAQNRLDEMLLPWRQPPAGEATELSPELINADVGLAQFRSPAQIAADGKAEIGTAARARQDAADTEARSKPLPTGEATELTPDEIDLETIPQPDVIEAGDGTLPPGMAPRTKSAEPTPAKPMTDADIVRAVVDGFRKENTPRARAFVQDFTAGRITPADVLKLVGRPPKSPDQRIADAAAQAPKKTTIQPGDILTVDGQPFGTRSGAYVRAKKDGGSVIEVPGGWAVRPKESVSEQPDVAGTAGRSAGPGDGGNPQAPRSGGNLRPDADGASGVDRVGPTPAPGSGGGAAVAVAPGGEPDAALSTDLPTLKRAWSDAVARGDTDGAVRINDRIVSIKAKKVDTSAQPVQETPKSEQVEQGKPLFKQGFDADEWQKARDDRIKESRESGAVHLDKLPAYVETMRGKSIRYVHDPKVKGRILTVDNSGNVYVEWLDAYSQEKEGAVPMKYGKKTVMQTSLGPRDLKDYALDDAKKAPTAAYAAILPDSKPAEEVNAAPKEPQPAPDGQPAEGTVGAAPIKPAPLKDRAKVMKETAQGGKRADGRTVPTVGAEVFTYGSGMGGSRSVIAGTVAKGANGLNVRIKPGAGIMGERIAQRTVPLSGDWTVAGEEHPDDRQRRESSERIEADSKQRKDARERMLTEAAARNGTLDPTTVKVGDVLTMPDGTDQIVESIGDKGEIYASADGNGGRYIGKDMRGIKLSRSTPAKPKVYKTKDGATKARIELGNTHKVQKVKGGFILREKTDKELAAESKNGRRLGGGSVDVERDSLLTAIAKLGGLSMKERPDTVGQGNKNVGGKMLFTRTGANLDEIANGALTEYGYIPAGYRDNPTTWLRDAIRNEFMGNNTYHSEQGTEWMEESQRQYEEANAIPEDPLDDFSVDDLEDAGYTQASPEAQALTEQLIAEAESLGIDTESIREDVAQRTIDEAPDVYHAAVQEAIRSAVAKARADAAGGNASAAQGSGQDRGEPAGQEGAEEGLKRRAPKPFEPRSRDFEHAGKTYRITVDRYWKIDTVQERYDPDLLAWTATVQRQDRGASWFESIDGDKVPKAVAVKANAFFENVREVDAGESLIDQEREDQGEAQGLTLEAQTAEDLRAKTEREEAATKAAAAKKAAEQERLRKEAEARDMKARADATVDDFQLGQDANAQMSGMGDMFADAPAPAPTADPFAADYAALVGKTIEQTVTTDDGKTAKLRMDAARALRDFDQREKTLADLKACLGRNG